MTQSIALDALSVAENAVGSQETGAVAENAVCSQETGVKKQGVDKRKALIIIVVFVITSLVSGLVAAGIKLSQSRNCLCPDEWIGFQDHCYYFSNHERDWNSSRNYCFTERADLTVIDDTTDVMDFLRQRKCTSDHWIGLEMKGNQTGKWVNGTIFNQLFNVSGNEACAYLSDDGVATARCYTERKFICRKKKAT